MEGIVYTINDWRGHSVKEINEFIKSCHRQNVESGINYPASNRNDDELKTLLEKSDFCVAYENEKIIGIRALQVKGDCGYFHTACISKSMRGKGLNSEMGRLLFDLAKKKSLKYVYKSTAEKNKASVKAGLKEGFVPFRYLHASNTNYYSIQMRKELVPSIYSYKMFCKLTYWRSYIKTHLTFNEDGSKTKFFKIYYFFRYLKKCN